MPTGRPSSVLDGGGWRSLAPAEAGDCVEGALLPSASFPLEVGNGGLLDDLVSLHLASHVSGNQVVPQKVLQAAAGHRSGTAHAHVAQADYAVPDAVIIGHLCAACGGQVEQDAGCGEHDVLHCGLLWRRAGAPVVKSNTVVAGVASPVGRRQRKQNQAAGAVSGGGDDEVLVGGAEGLVV